jgi:hypothetical protein
LYLFGVMLTLFIPDKEAADLLFLVLEPGHTNLKSPIYGDSVYLSAGVCSLPNF